MSYSTSTNNSIQANEVLGGLKQQLDLARLYVTANGEWQQSLVKATNRDICVPKQKHVELLVDVTFDSAITMNQLFGELSGRLSLSNNWVVILKSLILIHYLLIRGNTPRLMEYLNSHTGLLNLSSYRDSKSGTIGMEQSKNIKLYAQYLEERILSGSVLFLKGNTNPSNPRIFASTDSSNPSMIGGGDASLLLKLLTSLCSNCQFYLDSIVSESHELVGEVVRLCYQDWQRIYKEIGERIIGNGNTNNNRLTIANLYSLSQADARKVVDLYAEFVEINNEHVVSYLASLKRVAKMVLGLSGIPDISPMPQSVVSSLRAYVNSSAAEFEAQRQAKLKARGQQQQKSSNDNVPPPFSSSGLVDVFGGAGGGGGNNSTQYRPNSTYPNNNSNASFGSNNSGGSNQIGGAQVAFQSFQQPQQVMATTTAANNFDNLPQMSRNPSSHLGPAGNTQFGSQNPSQQPSTQQSDFDFFAAPPTNTISTQRTALPQASYSAPNPNNFGPNNAMMSFGQQSQLQQSYAQQQQMVRQLSTIPSQGSINLGGGFNGGFQQQQPFNQFSSTNSSPGYVARPAMLQNSMSVPVMGGSSGFGGPPQGFNQQQQQNIGFGGQNVQFANSPMFGAPAQQQLNFQQQPQQYQRPQQNNFDSLL